MVDAVFFMDLCSRMIGTTAPVSVCSGFEYVADLYGRANLKRLQGQLERPLGAAGNFTYSRYKSGCGHDFGADATVISYRSFSGVAIASFIAALSS
jgi:hypothetical protein